MNGQGYPLNNTNYNWERRNKSITGNQLIDTVSAMSENDKEALRQALGVSTQPNFNGWDYVDLGLPSGTLWATCNVGASTPEEVGNYYAFGEVAPKEEYTDENHTNVDVVSPELGNDAARVNMGGDWVLPTVAALKELLQYTTQEFVEVNGVEGILFTSTINNETLFFVDSNMADYPPTPGDGLADVCLWSSDAQFDGSNYGAGALFIRCALENPEHNNTASVYTNEPQFPGYSMRGVILGDFTPNDLDKYYSTLYPIIDVKWVDAGENSEEGEIPLVYNNSITDITDILASQISLEKLYFGHYAGLRLRGTEDSGYPGTIIPLYLVNKGIPSPWLGTPDAQAFIGYSEAVKVDVSGTNPTQKAWVPAVDGNNEYLTRDSWRPYLRKSLEDFLNDGDALNTAATYVELDCGYLPKILMVYLDNNTKEVKASFWQPVTD